MYAESHVADFLKRKKSVVPVAGETDLQDSVQICILKTEEGCHSACKPLSISRYKHRANGLVLTKGIK